MPIMKRRYGFLTLGPIGTEQSLISVKWEAVLF